LSPGMPPSEISALLEWTVLFSIRLGIDSLRLVARRYAKYNSLKLLNYI
jgi:hypothetical protein